jgi:serine phosphatase RsbU (regulator of sigma subunit)
MQLAHLFLLAAACILLAMSIESILRSASFLNFAAALILLCASIIMGSSGLIEYFMQRPFLHPMAFMMLQIENASLSSMGFFFLLFSNYFPTGRNKKLNLFFIIAALCVTLAMVVMIILRLNVIQYFPEISSSIGRYRLLVRYNFLQDIILGFSLSLLIISIFRIGFGYRKLELIYQRKQVRYFLAGVALFSLTFYLAYWGRSFLPYQAVYFLIAAAFVAGGGFFLYSVISYRFENLRKKFFYFGQEFLIGLVISIPLIILLFILNSWLSYNTFPSYLIIMSPILILFFWIYDSSRNLIKRMLGIEIYSKDATEAFLDKIGASLSIRELAKNSIELLIENINCKNCDFLYFDKEGENFNIVYSSGKKNYSVSALETFFRHISPSLDVYNREWINADPGFRNIKDITEKYCKKYEAALILPIFFENNLTALIHISNKLDNTIYTAKETMILSRIKKIIQIVLKNIILFDKEQESEITKRDLSLASNIQDSVFQKEIPYFHSMDVYAYLKPAKGVSGDYFLIEKINNNAMGILIADVSGKGFSAALIAMVIHTIAKSQEYSSTTTNAIVAKINEVMTSNQSYGKLSKTMSFATVFCGFMDISIQTLFYTNAGHYPMLIYDRKEKAFSSIRANSKPVGIFPDENYISETYHLEKNKIFILYSDGITEAINNDEEEFGMERMKSILSNNHEKSSKELVELIMDEVSNFAGENEQFDDMTLIIIKL